MDVDQQGPMFGPQTHADAMIEDIHERRARALEELNGRLHMHTIMDQKNWCAASRRKSTGGIASFGFALE